MKRTLPDLALKRPITMAMVVVTVLGLGAIAGYRIPVEFIPRLDMPFIVCFIPYPGATPEQVEREVAIPAEGEFRTVSNLKRIVTQSDSNGCNVRLQFEWDADMTLATAEVRDRMERLKLELPPEVDRLMLRRFSSNSLPIMAFALYRAGDEEELAHRVRTLLQPRLMRVEGVAEVSVFGKPEREVIIEFDQDALRRHGLGLYQVVGRLQASSLNVSVGNLVEGKTKYYVRARGEFTRPRQIADLVVGPNALRLSQVARVSYQAREQDEEFFIDSKGGVFVLVVKESEANTIATCRAVAAELEAARRDPVFEGMDVLMFMDQSDIILSALNGLREAGKTGGLLAVAVLFLFLRRFLPTVMVSLAIPASLTFGLVYMYFTGISLNLVTLASMIIAVGMLVDNAIVVIENIHRYGQMGFGPEERARRGANEVALAVTASTLTTLVVFLPMFYLETGEMAVYMRQFAGPVSVALLASLFLALTVVPVAVARIQPPTVLRERLGSRRRFRLPGAFAFLGRAARLQPFRRVTEAYLGLLGGALRMRAAAVLAIVVLILLTYAVPYQKVGVQKMPTVDTRQVDIEVVLDPNFDRERARETFALLQGVIERQREELGVKHIFVNYRPGGGSIQVYLLQPEDLAPGERFPYTTEQVLDILWQQFPPRLPGVELRFAIAEAGEGQTRNVTVMLRGEDNGVLEGYAENFKRLLATVPGLRDPQTDTERARPEVRIRIDEDLAEQEGVSPLVVARSVDFALRGIRLPYIKQGGREIPVWAQFREEDRETRANLENVTVLANDGELIPLNRLVTLERGHSPQAIRRIDGKNVVTLTAKLTGSDLGAVMREVNARIAAFELPPGYTLRLGDEFMELDTNMANFFTSLLLSIILIYIVMGALFESYVLPLSILTTVPLAFIGVYWTLYFTNTSLDTVAFIGCILMVGVVVNNGIIVIDHINQLRRGGRDRTAAILQGGRDRLRPVMMTALTTILGCVPLALGGGVGREISFTSLGRALIGGMTTGTLLTLVVVPLCYTLIDDARTWFLRYFADLRRLRRADPAKGIYM